MGHSLVPFALQSAVAVYAACYNGGATNTPIISIRSSTVTTMASFSQCSSARSVYTYSTTGVVYAACNGGGVISISGSTVTTLATSSQCPSPASVYSNTATGVVYAACMGTYAPLTGL